MFYKIILKLRIEGLENVPADGAVLLISNHQSFLDPVLAGGRIKRQITFMARDSLFTKPVLGKALYSVGAIPLKRDEADTGAIRKVIAVLKQQGSVCLFPEGTRTNDGRINAFKRGFGLICRRGGAAVVPVVIEGAFECWPRGRKFPKPGMMVHIRYGKPLSFDEVKTMDIDALVAHLSQTMQQMQNDIRKETGKNEFIYSNS